MKKNTKIGLGVAAASVIALAVAFPVFADIKSDDITKSGEVVTEETSIETEIQIKETQAEKSQTEETEVEETQAEEDVFDEDLEEVSSGTPDFENSPNFCKAAYDSNESDYKETVPSDYEDPELRRLAEEYVAKGYFIEDCEYSVTHYASGIGGDEYLFCNGFDVSDSKDGNNTFYMTVVKATPEEFEWYMGTVGYEVTYDGNVATIENNSDYTSHSYTYDRETEIFTFKVLLFAEGIG